MNDTSSLNYSCQTNKFTDFSVVTMLTSQVHSHLVLELTNARLLVGFGDFVVRRSIIEYVKVFELFHFTANDNGNENSSLSIRRPRHRSISKSGRNVSST